MKSKVFSLDQTTIKKLLTTYKLKIPDFQRSFVWKKGKKQQLLQSLFKGFPIGAITLYEDNESEFYYIIDGLQRINTLKQYLSQPSEIISFKEYYEKIEDKLDDYLEQNGLDVNKSKLKKILKSWYENLNKIYEFEKISVLHKSLQEDKGISSQFDKLELVEDLQKVLVEKIIVADEDIAIIIYQGEKENLPELFKNINTGSVGLSQYEILQSVWGDYHLDSDILQPTYEGFKRELEIIKSDYEIDAIKEKGEFDIFKNMIGLNNIICSIENCIKLFTTFKKIAEPIEFEGFKKYYDNDIVSFEILSTILDHSSNRIVKVIDKIFSNENDKETVSRFIQKLNGIIIDAINEAVDKMQQSNINISNSKYHSLYIVTGIIFSRYDIDLENLSVVEVDLNKNIYKKSLDFKTQVDKKWFIDENRQLGFFNKKIKELDEMKRK